MQKFRFRRFPVYKDALIFRREVRNLAKQFPKSEQFILNNQLLRALDSIILNIAEGSARSTDKDFAHFLSTSQASVHEVVACIDLAFMDRYISQEEHEKCLMSAEALANQITAFRRKLLNP